MILVFNFSYVVLFVNRFLIWTINSPNTGKMNNDKITFIDNKNIEHHYSMIYIFLNLNSNQKS